MRRVETISTVLTRAIGGILLAVTLCYGGLLRASDHLQDELIGKLEIVVRNLSPQDPQRIAVALRLADLLSEKARKVAQAELDKFGEFGKESTELRKKAIQLYESVLPKLSGSQRGKVFVQLGHLSELIGETKKAEQYYLGSTQLEEVPQEIRAEAFLALGELYYRNHQWSQAEASYGKAIDLGIKRLGFAQLRRSWACHYMGNGKQALVYLSQALSQPRVFFNRGQVSTLDIDRDQMGEVARDYVLLTAKRSEGVTQQELAQFSRWLEVYLDPYAYIKQLGFEYERLGNRSAADLTWKYLLENAPQPENRLVAAGMMVAGSLSNHQYPPALEHFDQFAREKDADPGCQSFECQEAQKFIRNMIVLKEKEEKLQPSSGLLQIGIKYSKVFPNDRALIELVALIAQRRKEFAQAVDLLLGLIPNSPSKEENERLWLLALEWSDASADEQLARRVRQNYLKESILQSKRSMVLYREIKYEYDKDSRDSFLKSAYTYVYETQHPSNLRVLVAHLILDSHAQAKSFEQIIADSRKWEELFAKDKDLSDKVTEFQVIRNRTAIEWARSIGEVEPLKAIEILSQVEPKTLSQEERRVLLKNQFLLNWRLKKFSIVLNQYQEILKDSILQSLAKELAAYAVDACEWIGEWDLAYQYWKKYLQENQVKNLLRGSVLAKASGQSPREITQYLKKAWELSSDPDEKWGLFLEWVRVEPTPLNLLDSQAHYVKKLDAEKRNRLLALLWARNPEDKVWPKIRTLMVSKESDPWATFLTHWDIYFQFSDLAKKIQAQTLPHHEKALRGAIQKRVQALLDLEKLAKLAVDNGVWSSKGAVLSLLARENERFYSELMSLPVPESLTVEEQNQYLTMLSQTAQPYQEKSQQIREVLDQIGQQSDPLAFHLLVINQESILVTLMKKEDDLLRRILANDHWLSVWTVSYGSLVSKPDLVSKANIQEVLKNLRGQFSEQNFENYLGVLRQTGQRDLADYLQSKREISAQQPFVK